MSLKFSILLSPTSSPLASTTRNLLSERLRTRKRVPSSPRGVMLSYPLRIFSPSSLASSIIHPSELRARTRSPMRATAAVPWDSFITVSPLWSTKWPLSSLFTANQPFRNKGKTILSPSRSEKTFSPLVSMQVYRSSLLNTIARPSENGMAVSHLALMAMSPEALMYPAFSSVSLYGRMSKAPSGTGT